MLHQSKLSINSPGDTYEREADRVAEDVVNATHEIPHERANAINASSVGRDIQRFIPATNLEIRRQIGDDGGSESFQDIEDVSDDEEYEGGEDDESGMPKREAGVSGAEKASVAELPSSHGHPIDPSVRKFMESRFGVGFEGVRIHTDAATAESAKELHAQAYTVGANIYFGQGKYSPQTDQGIGLLAHELTHVIQQTGAANYHRVQRKSAPPRKKVNVCSAGSCPQGKQPKEVIDDCRKSGPVDENKFISALNVSLSQKTVEVVWSDGKTETWPCSPNPNATPEKDDDRVGVKCSVKHTNAITKKRRKPDGMAWFTGFASEGRRIGFHNSQPVGPGFVSHGCVRVCCDKAEIINKNSWSGKTNITVKA